jgi:hypothetical protein
LSSIDLPGNGAFPYPDSLETGFAFECDANLEMVDGNLTTFALGWSS